MVNHPALKKDLADLEMMTFRLEELQRQLQDETKPHHERQIISAAIVSLSEIIAVKTRDVKRRLKGS